MEPYQHTVTLSLHDLGAISVIFGQETARFLLNLWPVFLV